MNELSELRGTTINLVANLKLPFPKLEASVRVRVRVRERGTSFLTDMLARQGREACNLTDNNTQAHHNTGREACNLMRLGETSLRTSES